jgi:hypothetical protein
VDRLLVESIVQIHLMRWNVGHLADIPGAAETEVGLNAVHPIPLDLAPAPHHGLGAVPQQLTNHPHVARLHQGPGSSSGGFLNQQARQGEIGKVEAFDEQRLTFSQSKGVIDQNLGKGFPAWVGHRRDSWQCDCMIRRAWRGELGWRSRTLRVGPILGYVTQTRPAQAARDSPGEIAPIMKNARRNHNSGTLAAGRSKESDLGKAFLQACGKMGKDTAGMLSASNVSMPARAWFKQGNLQPRP